MKKQILVIALLASVSMSLVGCAGSPSGSGSTGGGTGGPGGTPLPPVPTQIFGQKYYKVNEAGNNYQLITQTSNPGITYPIFEFPSGVAGGVLMKLNTPITTSGVTTIQFSLNVLLDQDGTWSGSTANELSNGSVIPTFNVEVYAVEDYRLTGGGFLDDNGNHALPSILKTIINDTGYQLFSGPVHAISYHLPVDVDPGVVYNYHKANTVTMSLTTAPMMGTVPSFQWIYVRRTTTDTGYLYGQRQMFQFAAGTGNLYETESLSHRPYVLIQ